jgi:MoxR-like ATPase
MINHYEKRELPEWLKPNEGLEAYLPGDGLKAALDVALELHMPLLLTGEPGTGKTRFAYHVAQHFSLGEVLRFDVKTTSTATDLFYFYDALRHFRLSGQGLKVSLEDSGIVALAALGKAIKTAQDEKRRSVVLIDEIDKAPRDFPNDLLQRAGRRFQL